MIETIKENELMEINGGFVLTGAAVGIGAGCLASGVAVGYAVGKVIKHFW